MLVLKTERLRLRWFAPGDEAFLLEQLQEETWKRNISDPGVTDLEAARVWMVEKLLVWHWPRGLGLWAVERASDGELMGMCGLLQRDYLPVPDIGYAFLPRYWGQGYAREAAQACRDYAHEVLGEPLLMASTATFNDDSGRLLEAIGMRHVDTRQLGENHELSKLYQLGEAAPASSDEAKITALLQRFFKLFDNRDGRLAPLAAVPFFMLPRTLISRGSPPDEAAEPQQMSVQQFLLPRLELLRGGRLQQFSEWVTEQRIEVSGQVAQVWLRYRKAGLMDGEAFEGEGHKSLQLLKTRFGWRIAALAWQDIA
ncbi:GNAT family N-acetyltransferase [Paucibacter sp. AS339]|uniref:GNAT family N-acetyltransferase n=1 Tax=Paucibacter hankyongi TaxID=3133434 RepID=UPI0030B65D15